jgi:hypothetical protein
MKRIRFQETASISILLACLGVALTATDATRVLAQDSGPTATLTHGTTDGMFITVISTEPQINVRAGPSSVAYVVVGFLLPGQTAPALGRSPGGDWIQISFPGTPGGVGWVYSPLVAVSPGTLRVIEPPPTPIPPPTNTIDPTFAAQFNTEPTSTRLPTFTPPAASLVAPSFPSAAPPRSAEGLPMGVMILVLASIGSAGFLLSLAGRR